MNVTLNGSSFDLKTEGLTFKGHKGSTHTGDTYTGDINETGYNTISVMKLVAGHKINIDNVKITYGGNGSRWLFHTDGHDDNGDSTWVLGNGTKVNITGTNLRMYTSQYHNVARL